MPDSKISGLTSATTPLAGTEVLPIVQSSTTKQVSVADLTAGRAISASGLTLSGLTASTALALDASKQVVSVTNTGSGNNVLATSPTLVTPNLGTPTALTLTNATGLPISGITGLGTGVGTALGINVGSSGAFVVNGGALGTPSSGTVTNLTGTASININGTVGATTPTTGAFTTLSASSSVTLSGGLADCVVYLNSSKVVSTKNTFVFDGTNLGLGSTPASWASNARALTIQSSGSPVEASLCNPGATNAISIAHNAYYNAGWKYVYASSYTAARYDIEAGVHAWYTAGSGTAGNAITFTQAMTLDANGSLGIGTTATPDAKLDITGGSSTGGLIVSGSIAAVRASSVVLDMGDSNRLMALGPNSTTAGTLKFIVASSNASVYTTAATIDASGNLGLGVTPSAWAGYKPVQAGTGASFGGYAGDVLSFVGSNAYNDNTNWRYIVGGNAAARYQQSAGVHAWYTAPSGTAGNAITFTQAMTLDASGNLLLGYTSNNLQSGTFGQTIYGSIPGLTFAGTETSARVYTLYETGGSFKLYDRNAGADRWTVDAYGNLGLGVTPSAWGTGGNARAIQMGATAVYSFSDSRGEILTNAFHNGTNYVYRVNYPAVAYSQEANTGTHKWYTAPSGTAGNAISFTQAMTLDASGNLLVGTTTASGRLTVNASTSADSRFVLQLSGTPYCYFGGYSGITGSGNADDVALFAWTGKQLMFGTNGTERMRIDSSGNVGIGVTPSAKLDVVAANFVGGPAIGARYNTSNARIGFNIANSNGFPYIGYNTNNANGSDTPTYDLTQAATQLRMDGGQFRFGIAPSGTAGNTISFTQAMTLGSDGNLAVGSASTGNARTFSYINDAALPAIVARQDGAAPIQVWQGPSGAELARITSGGNLLVGTTTSSARIISAVADGTYSFGAVGTTKAIRITHSSTASKIEGVDSTLSASYQPLVLNGSYLSFETSGTERARIPAAGGMVVGTAALATNATDGFLYVPTCAGTPTGTPTTQTGTAPIVIDTTNNKLYFYSGGAWRDAGP